MTIKKKHKTITINQEEHQDHGDVEKCKTTMIKRNIKDHDNKEEHLTPIDFEKLA